MIRLFLLLLMFYPSHLLAEPWPQVAQVIGVSADDHLNIRQGPSINTKVIGRFEPTQSGIEVIATSGDGRWAQVNAGEQSGWAALRFLKVLATQVGVPERFYCRGTEPFWAANFERKQMTFSSPGADERKILTSEWLSSSNQPGRFAAVSHTSTGSQTTTILSRAQCSDGMSDRAYGFMLDLVFRLNGSPTHLTGCCSLTK
ncbi:MAG: SH3 domain-containing protein [Pseudomonadota bacterium]